MQPQNSSSGKNGSNNTRIFSQKPNRLGNVMIPIVVIVLLLGGESSSNSLNAISIVVALGLGLITYGLMYALTPRSKIILSNDQIHYRKKSLNLSQLATVGEYTIYGPRLNASFRLIMTDRSNNRVKIPLENLEDQGGLLTIIGSYATKAGATINNRAAKLIEEAKTSS